MELSARYQNILGILIFMFFSLFCLLFQSVILYSCNSQPDCCNLGAVSPADFASNHHILSQVCSDSLPHAITLCLHIGQLQEGGHGGLGPLHLPRTSGYFHKGDNLKPLSI